MKATLFTSLSLATLLAVTGCSTTTMQHTVKSEHNSMNMQTAHSMAYMKGMKVMSQGMAAGVVAKNADIGFAQGMIPHHQGAVEMAKIELQYGKDPEMRALAQNIINAQLGEISYMQNWLNANTASQPAVANAQAITQAYKANMMKNHEPMMQGIMATDPDVAFVKGMIPHHQGAVDMSNVELQYGKNPDMRKLAEQIKQAQTPEIKQMQAWLVKHGVN